MADNPNKNPTQSEEDKYSSGGKPAGGSQPGQSSGSQPGSSSQKPGSSSSTSGSSGSSSTGGSR